MSFIPKVLQRLFMFGTAAAVVPFLVVADVWTIIIELTTGLRGPWSVRLAVTLTSVMVFTIFVMSGGLMMMSKMHILQPTLTNPLAQFEIQIQIHLTSSLIHEIVTFSKLIVCTCLTLCIVCANALIHVLMYPVLACAFLFSIVLMYA